MPGKGREPVALISGGGRGIGRATAWALAFEGYTVVLAERRPALGRRAEAALASAGGRALFVHTDVADPRSVERAVRLTLRRFERLDCLVNNAGVLRVGRLVTLPVRDLDRMITVNLRGLLLLSRAVLPVMLRQGAGTIINVASLLGTYGAGEYATYCATKFGVVGFTEALAQELDGTGVRVWAVCPGLVDTWMARQTGVTSGERRALIQPEAVARVIASLAKYSSSQLR